MASKTLEEKDVGILCYVSKLRGFRGILKQRYSDFIVNEVDTDGNVVHLTSLDAPSEAPKPKPEIKKASQSVEIDKSYASEIALFRSLAGDSDADSLKVLIDQINELGGNADDSSVCPIVLSSDSDKSHRAQVHNFFKENLGFLVSDTIDDEKNRLSKRIRVRLDSGVGGKNSKASSKKRKERNGKPFDSRGSDHWPQELGKFLKFHLYKENKDTQEALGVIGKMLGVLPRSFGFSGTKDKRAVTTQRVTIFKQNASRVAGLNDRLIGIKVGDFCYVKEGLLLGQLSGNRFTITLRGVVADSEDTIRGSAESLGKHGFINYFGLQRFGSGSVPTHAIGAALLRGEWKAAASLLLDPRDGERDAIRKAREYFKETSNFEGTLRQLPRNMTAERAVLQSLKKCPGNHLQALKAIPRTLRMLYTHSYQSYLWNNAVSKRVEKYGISQVVLGDLVYCKGFSSEDLTEPAVPEFEDTSFNGANDSLNENSETENLEEKSIPVKAINAEDLESGTYTINDVILPMPGSRVIYPANDIAEVYHDLAKKDGISLMESVHNVKEFSVTSLTGGYRRVLQKPKDFEWELLTYTDGSLPLAATDLDMISKFNPVKTPQEEVSSNTNGKSDSLMDCTKQLGSTENDKKPSIVDNGLEGEREPKLSQAETPCAAAEKVAADDVKKAETAVKLSFTLPSSSYATMAIRELLKTSTSVAFHKTLN